MDITDINGTRPLKGPWVLSSTSSRSFDNNQSILLPQFIENHIKYPNKVVALSLTLKTVPNIPLSINMKQPYSVWKLYADGKLIGSSGKFDQINGKHKAEAYYPIINFTPLTTQTKLLLYLANSQHRHIGFYGVPLIAPQGILEKHHLYTSIIEKIVATILFLFGLYHIAQYIVWKKDQAPLWFGAVCISFAIRTTTTGEKIILDYFPNLSWEMLARIEYSSAYIALPFFVLYFGALYPKRSSVFAEYSYLFVGLLFTGFSLFSSTLFFTASLSYYNIVVLTFVFYIFWVLFQSFQYKEKGSLLAFLAFSFFSATIVHDLLLFENMIIFLPIDLMPYGFMIYLIAQATILLQRSSEAFYLIEKHTTDLEDSVSERTRELLLVIEQRELLLRELTHRVKNNLQFIIGLLWIQRKEADIQTQESLKILESQIQSIATVHESLCSQDAIEMIEIHEYIRKLIFSLKRLHSGLEISLNSHDPIYIQTDHTITLGLIINELITNHIKYSAPYETSSVHIFIEKSLDLCVILHYNDGIDHRETFQKAQMSSSFGLPKLGWSMIKEFVKQMDANIIVYHDHLDLHFLACEHTK
ncbi:MAG: 7TM diverse intracellular signaling domain-containing protein [Sulfuricurvum sp.]|uniref:histidine kinase dimerization/phosphoacceptor domain -containing protein n=1 Tax=Sulfuricurvum sp. TaxID=2025608 RepID=UPI0026245DA0|nr:histidine kinase dimerization/phosphoacceptor domain -containing protein [Sulfuricurvum sp.]MDD2830059.1 7TM diverse intracellular signaling domain-containing protein [Sulfuricurvum sp.]MDD4950633.1 7TM diverse intracellular signaling domain-containing protein [Sulfuricurvum sp.]